MDTNDKVAPVEDAQIVEDKTKEELEKAAEAYEASDPAMASDLKKLANSRLSLESFNDYMRLRAEQEKLDAMPANEKRHREKVLAKRRAAEKRAKKARKLNRKK